MIFDCSISLDKGYAYKHFKDKSWKNSKTNLWFSDEFLIKKIKFISHLYDTKIIVGLL
jgi:hypothetical protein